MYAETLNINDLRDMCAEFDKLDIDNSGATPPDCHTVPCYEGAYAAAASVITSDTAALAILGHQVLLLGALSEDEFFRIAGALLLPLLSHLTSHTPCCVIAQTAHHQTVLSAHTTHCSLSVTAFTAHFQSLPSLLTLSHRDWLSSGFNEGCAVSDVRSQQRRTGSTHHHETVLTTTKQYNPQSFSTCHRCSTRSAFIGQHPLRPVFTQARFDILFCSQISRQDFLHGTLVTTKGSASAKLEFAFTQADIDGSGELSMSEVRPVVHALSTASLK